MKLQIFISILFQVLGMTLSEYSSEDLDLSINNLGLVILRDLSSNPKNKLKNIVFSPLSVAQTFSMMSEGATDETLIELKDALGQAGIKDLHLKFKRIFDLIERKAGDDFEIRFSCILFLPWETGIKEEFWLKMLNNYKAGIMRLDFRKKNSEAIDDMNTFLRRQTFGQIKEIIDEINPDTKLVLMSAAYLKGEWKYKFPKDASLLMEFTNSDSSISRVDAMHTVVECNYYEDKKMQVVEIPFVGNMAYMVIILLRSSTIKEFMTSVDFDELYELNERKSLTAATFDLYMPKFKIETGLDLKDTISNLGGTRIFTRKAELRNFLKEGEDAKDLFVRKALLGSFFEVNEEGSKPSASESAPGTLNEMNEAPVLEINRPFIYYIKSPTLPNFLLGVVQKL